MFDSLHGKRYLVTGASSGIGRGVAILLAEQGAHVVLNGRREDALAATLKQMRGDGHHIRIRSLGDLDEAASWIREVASEVGPLDGFVHCAGIQTAMPVRGFQHRHFEESMKVNVESAMGLLKGYRQKGVNPGAGSVVLIASVLGLCGQPVQSIYSATKGAVLAMAKSAALELVRDGIRVNCVAPAIVETELVDRLRATMTPEQFQAVVAAHPLGLGQAKDVANAVAFLLGETGRWITGTTLTVDGGYTAQ